MASVRRRTRTLLLLGVVACVMVLAADGHALALLQLPTCGDGIVQPATGEQCDDADNPCCDPATCRFRAEGVSCDGSSACAQSVCNGQGSCLNLARADGTTCDDGNPCTVADQCLQGFCFGGPARDCNDENVCTDDTCNPQAPDIDSACEHTPNQDPCDDGAFCNGTDTCAAGACTHGGDPCANGAECNRACNEDAASCVDPAGTPCTDDGNVCTDDTCNGDGSCTHPNNTAPCDDGVFCDGADVCAGGACIHAGDPCASGAPCDRTCNEAAENCLSPSGSTCTDDGNVCTDDTCDGQGNCAHPNNTGPCDDGVFCNGADTCQGGACLHAGDPCTQGPACDHTCREGEHDCHDAAGAACPDDQNVCTDDACDGQGACAHIDNTATCDDGVFCNGADTCQGGTCVVHAGDPCLNGAPCDRSCSETADNCLSPVGAGCPDDGNVCTDDACDGQGNCAHASNTAACDDGVFCNGADQCQGGACQHAGDPCAGGDECDSACNENGHSCLVPPETPCADDHDSCTLDVCDGEGLCTHPTAPGSHVVLSVGEANNTADGFCLDLNLASCGTQVSLLQGVLRAPAADFTLEAGSVTCGGLPAGFQCNASGTGDGVKFVVVPPVTQPPTCIDPTSSQAVVHLCLKDNAPICSGQDSVPLELADVRAVDCAGDDASPATEDGTVACSGLLGDCNADGDLDTDDLLAQVDVALQSGTPTLQQQARCDDDCDGDVDIFDMRDQIQAITAGQAPPLVCSAEANAGSGGPRTRVAMKTKSLRLVNHDGAVRGVQLTLTPTNGPVTVIGAKVTKRAKGFSVVYRQLDPSSVVRVFVVSASGKTIARGTGPIVKLSLARARHRGQLHLTDVKIAR